MYAQLDNSFSLANVRNYAQNIIYKLYYIL